MYVADFETTTDVTDCRVWAWAICEIDNANNVIVDNSLDSFMEFVRDHPDVYYFHNLKFDGEFIISWLFEHGFDHNSEGSHKENSFHTLISNKGQFYSMDICFSKRGKKKANVSEFRDSLKKLPMSVEEIAKSFNLPLQKLEIDYDAPRPVGHHITDEEKAYITNDVRIVAEALSIQFSQDLKKLTIGSDALSWYKSIRKGWNNLFPVFDNAIDENIRRSYRGGWVYCNPKFQGKIIKEHGIVLDVNSLYPSVMYDRRLPVGQPVYFDERYTEDRAKPLYIQFVTCHIKLKENHLPTIQIKGNPYFMATEYITDSGGMVDLALTSVDLELLFDHYEVEVLSWNGGYKFAYATGLFCEYIDYWSNIKKSNTGGIRLLAKLMLNSLYGKFATNPDVTAKIPYLKEDESIGYRLGEPELRDPVYTPMGCFITAYARDVTIRASQANYDRFLYADTDSMHLLGDNVPEGIEVHPTKLGAWSEEAAFNKAKYIRAKSYMEQITHLGIADDMGEMFMKPIDEFLDVKCAGAPKDAKRFMTFDNFEVGSSFDGKLRPQHVKGGIVLVPTTFTIM